MYNDTLSYVGSPRVCYNNTKKLSHSIAYCAIFAQTALGVIPPPAPIAGIKVNEGGLL